MAKGKTTPKKKVISTGRARALGFTVAGGKGTPKSKPRG